jgi:hypothetical protein
MESQTAFVFCQENSVINSRCLSSSSTSFSFRFFFSFVTSEIRLGSSHKKLLVKFVFVFVPFFFFLSRR